MLQPPIIMRTPRRSPFPVLLSILSLGVLASLTPSAIAATSDAPESYMRVARPDADTVELQIVARQFKPAKGNGPILWLTGVTHIGDVKYYEKLQEHLDAQVLVLFEGVGERPVKPAPKKADDKNAPDDEMHSVQSTMATSLGLVFQLEAIDYNRQHFVNSDLSVDQIRFLLSGGEEKDLPQRNGIRNVPPRRVNESPAKKAQKKPAQPASTPAQQHGAHSAHKDSDGEQTQASQQFDRLMQVMDGSSALGAIVDSALRFIGSSPKLKAITKLMFVETLGGLKGDLSKTQGIPPELQKVIQVLIRSRNQTVVEDLKTYLAKETPPASISVFYGAGHMDDLETRVRKELGYTPIKDEWYTAFSVNTREAGVSSAEKAMISYFIKIQMQMLNPKVSKPKDTQNKKEPAQKEK
jgi:hypothetical protein